MVITMKRIFSVLIGLLLLGSVFGIASVMSPTGKVECYAKAGDTVTLSIGVIDTECHTFEITNNGTSQMTLISGPVCYDEVIGGTAYKVTEYTYYIRNAGTLDIDVVGDGFFNIECNILPRSYPMQKFMDMFGLGKEK